MNLNYQKFEKIIKKMNLFLYLSLIFLVLTISLLILGIKHANQKLPQALNMNNLITSKELKINEYAYVDINTTPYLFASYTTGLKEERNKFYFVMDQNDFLYILYMSDKKYQSLSSQNITEKTFRVFGITKEIKNDIKKLAINSYNSLMQNEYLTEDNFQDYVGLVYLDLETNYYNSSFYYLGSFVFFIIFLVLLINYLINKKALQQVIKKYSKIELDKIFYEMEEVKNNPYTKMKLYLTKNYVVDLANKLVIFKYEDIIWVYPYEYRYNGLLVNRNLKVVTKDKKIYDICYTKYFNKDKNRILEEVIQILKKKNNKILIGFNKENQDMIKTKEKLKNN